MEETADFENDCYGSFSCLCAYIFGGMLVEKDALMGISATLLLVGSFFVVFYMGIESILILNRDLKTKQSYMIWMTPKSVWEILGAKFVVAIAQMFSCLHFMRLPDCFVL